MAGKSLLEVVLQQEGARTSNRFPCPLAYSLRRAELVAYMG